SKDHGDGLGGIVLRGGNCHQTHRGDRDERGGHRHSKGHLRLRWLEAVCTTISKVTSTVARPTPCLVPPSNPQTRYPAGYRELRNTIGARIMTFNAHLSPKHVPPYRADPRSPPPLLKPLT